MISPGMNGESKNEFVYFSMSGSDAFDFAQRIFSRQILQLNHVGEPCLMLEPNGKLISWFWLIKKEAQKISFIVEKAQHEALRAAIDRYHFAEDLQLDEPQETFVSACSAQEQTLSFNNQGFLYDFESTDGPQLGDTQLEALRIRAGLPLETKDEITGRLVFETALEKFCDRNKGCYVGQEVVERVLSRGGDASKKLKALCSEEISLSVGNKLSLFDNEAVVVGETTRSFAHEESKTWILAYLKKTFLKQPEQTLFLESNGHKAAFYAV